MKKAIIFDLDGCLVESEVLSLKAIAHEARRLGGHDVDEKELGKALLGLRMSNISEWVGRRARQPVPDGFAERIDAQLMEQYPQNLRPVDGAAALLEQLVESGIDMALATGSSVARMTLALQVTDLARFFNSRACSADQVVNGKPAPDLFFYAAGLIGRAPRECLVLEDSPHGVEGALAAGMCAIGFVGGGHLEGWRDQHADTLMKAGCVTTIRELSELSALVQGNAALPGVG